MDLPFIGKSSYKAEFAGLSLTERSTLQRPKDCIKTADIELKKMKSFHEEKP